MMNNKIKKRTQRLCIHLQECISDLSKIHEATNNSRLLRELHESIKEISEALEGSLKAFRGKITEANVESGAHLLDKANDMLTEMTLELSGDPFRALRRDLRKIENQIQAMIHQE